MNDQTCTGPDWTFRTARRICRISSRPLPHPALPTTFWAKEPPAASGREGSCAGSSRPGTPMRARGRCGRRTASMPFPPGMPKGRSLALKECCSGRSRTGSVETPALEAEAKFAAALARRETNDALKKGRQNVKTERIGAKAAKWHPPLNSPRPASRKRCWSRSCWPMQG